MLLHNCRHLAPGKYWWGCTTQIGHHGPCVLVTSCRSRVHLAKSAHCMRACGGSPPPTKFEQRRNAARTPHQVASSPAHHPCSLSDTQALIYRTCRDLAWDLTPSSKLWWTAQTNQPTNQPLHFMRTIAGVRKTLLQTRVSLRECGARVQFASSGRARERHKSTDATVQASRSAGAASG